MNVSDFKSTRNCQVCSGTGRLYDDTEVGAALKAERESRGTGLRQLARLIGWSAAYLSKLEHGVQQWNAARIEVFLRRLENKR